MAEFWPGSRFDMQVNDLVQAKLIAINERGSSVVSDANLVTGAHVQVVPS